MGTVEVNVFLTVDGVLQAPGAADEDREGGFPHGGWTAPSWDDPLGELVSTQLTGAEALLLGRRTYDIFAAHWPRFSGDPLSDTLNAMPKYVGSRTLTAPGWGPVTVLRDAAEDVAALKRERPGMILVYGSGHLLQTLMAADLIDVYRLWTFPLILGTGKRLFEDGARPGALRLTGSVTSSTGVIVSTYERAGAVRYGSFTADD